MEINKTVIVASPWFLFYQCSAIKLKGTGVVYAMKAYRGSECIAPFIPNLGARWR